MLWRGWCFISGTPTGALAALALLAEPGAAALAIGAVAGGIAFAGAASWIARRRDDDPARGPHLATAASSGWVALPGCGMALLGLAPGAAGLLAVVTVLVAVALARGARRQGPVDARRRLLGGLVEPVAGAIALVATSAALASLGAATPVQSEARAAAVYDLDAQVVTRELPFCAQRVASWRVLLDRGAHPRWSADGVALWFDAPDDAGARQVYRLHPSADEAEPVCWTCGQPGNNARPAPGPLGGLVVFDSDREATWLHPSNT
ncbi:MAG: hypothetical protein O7G30_02220, partial [Proteobacteria bacterium]|nr:hypothetical protein [Pseudomonadota bacterium]